MFAYLKGRVEEVSKDILIIDVNDIGYIVNICAGDSERLYLQVGQTVKIHIYTDIKEDDISLYGFMDKEAISVFEKLKKVSGIGSKVARGILSYMTPQDVCFAIASEDIALLNKVPGVGGKTAARIILELKDKVLKEDKLILSSYTGKNKSKTNTHETDAVLALKVLGYSQAQIVEAIEDINIEGLRVEEIIKKTLSSLNGK